MRKRRIALSMVLVLLAVMVMPMPAEAAPRWWGRFKEIVKADALGALDGYLDTGTGSGAIIGGLKGSIGEALENGEGGGGYTPPADAEASVGLHHNLALGTISGDQPLTVQSEAEIDAAIDAYMKIAGIEGELMASEWEVRSEEEILVRVLRSDRGLSDDFVLALEEAMAILEEDADDPGELVEKAAMSLKTRAAKMSGIEPDEIDFAELEAVARELMASDMPTDAVAAAIVADVLMHSYEYWESRAIDADDEEPMPEPKAGPGWWQKLKRIVKADVNGALGGFAYTGSIGGGLAGGIGGSIIAGQASDDSGGGWTAPEAEMSIGLLHNLGVDAAIDDDDMDAAILSFLAEAGYEEGAREALASGLDPLSEEFFKWLEEALGASDAGVSSGFFGALEGAMAILDGDPDSDGDGIDDLVEMSAESLLDYAATASDVEAEIVSPEDFDGMRARLEAEGKPLDILYASIYADVLIHSMDYWSASIIPPMIDPMPEPVQRQIRLVIDEEEASVDSEAEMLDVPPMITGGRTMVPFRFIGEALGAQIGWEGSEKRVSYQLGDVSISLFIDQNMGMVNGEEITLDSAPMLRDGRTLVPVRVISETLGYRVDWNAAEKSVTISGE